MIKIGVSPITGEIYRGSVRPTKHGMMWSGKKEVITDECIAAAAESLLVSKQSFVFDYKGKTMVMKVEGSE